MTQPQKHTFSARDLEKLGMHTFTSVTVFALYFAVLCTAVSASVVLQSHTRRNV